jgi:aminoglycoside phosphotransferase (APT) family kinase protein
LSDVIVAPETRDLDELAASLVQWLGAKMLGARDVRIDNLSYPRGAGQSHETILFDAHWQEGGQARSQGCVVRIKPSAFTVFPDNLFDEQYRIMKVMHEGGYVRVARPMWLENDASVIGKPFFLMEKVEGRVPVSIPPYGKSGWLFDTPPAKRRILWENAVRQLAAVQLVPLSEVGFLAGPDHARDGLAQEWDKYMRFVDWLGDDPRMPVIREGVARLKSRWPENQPEGLVWGDARIGNMMFDEDCNVLAVMDWEQPSLGGALQDLAWFCTIAETMHGRSSTYGGYLEGMGTREETVALWQEITGKSAADLEWYEDFTQLKMSLTGIRLDNLLGTEMVKAEHIKARLKVD